MTLKRIRLELARSHNHPQGSTRHGYEFTAPLKADGHIDEQQFAAVKDACSVHRFWEGEDDEHGQLVRTKKGWAFSYAPGDEDDEAAFRFASHAFKPGEYLSVKGHDRRDHTFRVVSVRDAPARQS
jgi:hypothetical protein